MGREIRKVPPNWQHPMREYPDHRSMRMVERYQPLYNHPFAPVMEEWYAGWKQWERGERPDYATSDDKNLPYWEWAGGPPDPTYYRADWAADQMTWFQLYETVSEGTPVTPPFATKEELVTYLADHGDFWDQLRTKEGRQPSAPWGREAASRFVDAGWAPSLVVTDGQAFTARDGLALGKGPATGEQR